MVIEAIVVDQVSKKEYKHVIAFPKSVKSKDLNENVEFWARVNKFKACSWKVM